jgi:thiamine-phosphate pyrophosphorylase
MREPTCARLRGLYAVTPDEADSGRLLALTECVLAARPALLQYRNKIAAPELRLQQATALGALCQQAKVPLIINDDLLLAEQVGAAGVHLGSEDAALDAARRRLGDAAIIGASCYGSLDLARGAAAAGASYVAFGAAFASSTKPAAERIDVRLLPEARRALTLPICAIGGINRENAPTLLLAGADLLAVISDLFTASDPELAARQYQRLFLSASGGPHPSGGMTPTAGDHGAAG